MKTKVSSSILQAAVVLLVVVGGMQAVSAAQSNSANASRIVGVWDVQVTVLNCSTGVQIASFKALHKYELGGTAQFVSSANPAVFSPQVGVWSPAPKDQYQVAFKMFQFDGAGNNIGWNVVRNTVTINKDATLYAGTGRADIYDLNGNLLGSSCPTFTGTRFK